MNSRNWTLAGMRTLAAGAMAIMALATGGCTAGRADLEAAPTSDAIAGGAGVVDRLFGMEIRAVASAWPGAVEITHEVTPMRVVIRNQSAMPMLVQYRNFALVAHDGTRYNALPPLSIDAEVTREVAATVVRPAFTYDGFVVAPYYSGYYPGFGVATNPYWHDPLYYESYYDYWVDIPLPTEQMLNAALPDGRLEPGGSLSGWLYFEKVDPGLDHVRFRADLVDADSGRQIGEISMPFVVTES